MKNRTLWISIAAFAVLAVLFAFTDLPIVQRVANPDSVWGYYMQAYGQIPGALVGLVGLNVLFRLHKIEKTFKSVSAGIALGLLSIMSATMLWGEIFGQQVDAEVNRPLTFVLGLLLVVAFQVWFRRIPKDTMLKYRDFARVATILMFVAGVLTVWAIKIPWGRWTYRDILEVGDLGLYTPWYLPQGNNGHHSFVSGHTALSFCVLPVVLLYKGSKTQYRIAWASALAWGIIGAISRVAIGAHYPSDVLFGGGQTLLWFWILQNRFVRENKS